MDKGPLNGCVCSVFVLFTHSSHRTALVYSVNVYLSEQFLGTPRTLNVDEAAVSVSY